jgi:hypothetical protein
MRSSSRFVCTSATLAKPQRTRDWLLIAAMIDAPAWRYDSSRVSEYSTKVLSSSSGRSGASLA